MSLRDSVGIEKRRLPILYNETNLSPPSFVPTFRVSKVHVSTCRPLLKTIGCYLDQSDSSDLNTYSDESLSRFKFLLGRLDYHLISHLSCFETSTSLKKLRLPGVLFIRYRYLRWHTVPSNFAICSLYAFLSSPFSLSSFPSPFLFLYFCKS